MPSVEEKLHRAKDPNMMLWDHNFTAYCLLLLQRHCDLLKGTWNNAWSLESFSCHRKDFLLPRRPGMSVIDCRRIRRNLSDFAKDLCRRLCRSLISRLGRFVLWKSHRRRGLSHMRIESEMTEHLRPPLGQEALTLRICGPYY